MISLREITIGIPSVSRPEELDKTLSQLVDDCDNILVYLNGVKEKKKYDAIVSKYSKSVSFVRSSTTVGIAAAWNRLIIESDTRWVVLSSDDLEYPKEWYKRMLEHLKDQRHRQLSLSYPMSFSSFCLDKKLVGEIGWFDQNFPGAYYEDEDWYLRIREYHGLHGNNEVKYEELIPMTKSVVRHPHARANWNALANYVYFRLKWKKVKKTRSQSLHTREEVAVVRILKERKWTRYQKIRCSYQIGDYSKKQYSFIRPYLYLRILKKLGGFSIIKYILKKLK